MRHRVAGRKLTRDTQHRTALRRNMVRALLINGRVVTTQAKAKAIRPYVEKLITWHASTGDAAESNTEAVAS